MGRRRFGRGQAQTFVTGTDQSVNTKGAHGSIPHAAFQPQKAWHRWGPGPCPDTRPPPPLPSCRHARGLRTPGTTQPGRALPVSAHFASSISLFLLLFFFLQRNCRKERKKEKQKVVFLIMGVGVERRNQEAKEGGEYLLYVSDRYETFWSELCGCSDWFPFLWWFLDHFQGFIPRQGFLYSKCLSTKRCVSKDLLLI